MKARGVSLLSSCPLSESQIEGLHGFHRRAMVDKLKYKDITEKIIGASFEVHKFLGNGFQEVIYQRALAWELTQSGLSFAREIEQEIFYKELPDPIGTRRADFVVEGKILVELKAIIELEDVHLAQVLNYLKAYKLEVGLLINFGSKRLTFKRLVL
jgi:GxxExxY protein